MEEKLEKLPIPMNTLDSDDVIEGIGIVEITIIGAFLFIGVVITMMMYLNTKDPLLSTSPSVILIAVIIFLIRRNKNNENVIDMLKILFKYWVVQKLYLYVTLDVYEEYIKDGEEE